MLNQLTNYDFALFWIEYNTYTLIGLSTHKGYSFLLGNRYDEEKQLLLDNIWHSSVKQVK